MSANKPKVYIDDYRTQNFRAAEENRAKWFYYLYKEGIEQGLLSDFAKDAMSESGAFLAGDIYKGICDVDGFVEKFMDEVRVKAYEGVVIKGEKQTRIECGYCPLVNAWSKLAAPQELPVLCGICEQMYVALCSKLGLEYRVESSIAAGASSCMMCIEEGQEK